MHYSIQDFIQLIAQLRNPNGGCPWDLKQNYESMIPCLTEETYEVIEAIEKKDIPNLREELGDLLLQVVFFSQLATEDKYFTFDDVLQDIAEKLYAVILTCLVMQKRGRNRSPFPLERNESQRKTR